MTRLVLILVAALALLAPATALADNSIEVKDGIATFKSDDTGLANNYTVEVVGDEVRFFDDRDPAGTASYPYTDCRGEQATSDGSSRQAGFKAIYCPKSMFKGIVAEPASGEDSVVYKIGDLPGVLSGNAGADVLTSADAADDLSGEQGNDTLTSGGGDDFLSGDEGNDKLDAGAGNDKLMGATGTDTFLAGPGDDTVLAADGLAETVDCGDGNDTITADAADTLTSCENVTTQNVAAPTEQPTADDKVKPKLDVGGSSAQRLGKRISFVATCSERGLVQAIGFVRAGGITEAFKLVERKVTVGGGGVVVKFPLSKRQRNMAAGDLKRKRKPKARVIISCVDDAGNTSTARRFWIGLRR